MTDVALSCRCGGVRGVLRDAAPRNGCNLVCYCRDCRAFARHLGVTDALAPGGGTPLFQTLPDRIEITSGQDHVACLRMTGKGLLRWYAACCGTPLANTVATSRMPLAGLWVPLLADPAAIGPVVSRGFTKSALPGGPKKDKGMGRLIGGLLRRAAAAYLAGTARRSPFFDADGRPVAEPRVLTPDERRAAYAG